MTAAISRESSTGPAERLAQDLSRIDVLVRGLVKSAGVSERATGQFVTGDALDHMLAAPIGQPCLWGRGGCEVPAASRLEAARLSEELDRAAAAGEPTRFHRLRRLFDLSPFEQNLLLLTVAPAVDPRYQSLYGFLQNDPAKTCPSVHLALTLLCEDAESHAAGLAYFHRDSTLFRHGLLRYVSEPFEEGPGLLASLLAVDTRIAGYLLGSDAPDELLRLIAEIPASTATLNELCVPGATAAQLRALPDLREGKLVCHFRGPSGFGKRTVAAALCGQAGLRLLAIDCESLGALTRPELAATLGAIYRESLLQPAAVYFDCIERLAEGDRRFAMAAVLRLADDLPSTCFLAGERVWEPPDSQFRVAVRRVDFLAVSAADRKRMWSACLNGSGGVGEAAGLSGRFRLSPAQIRDASATARNLASSAGRPIEQHDLFEACRMQSSTGLRALARKIHPRHTWDDIVLPPDRVQILREICSSVKHRARVYDDWGFDRKLSLGKGLAVLFTGAPGTGKTLAAEIMGATLGLDLYKVDLSVVVSKYIGETEKNLSRIFSEAENTNAILFFDEADALFGRRSEVRDSHDRYANIEVGYLLQRMEEYEGMVILATNFRKNMDEAFVRRLHQTLEFPLPNAEDRARIWRGMWPPAAPLAPECDFDALARRYEITGGSIRNVALAAAFLAAEDDARVSPKHLMHALRREYQKMGKVVADGFDPRAAQGSGT